MTRLFVLLFEDEVQRKSYKQYYLLTVETKAHNVMIDGQNLFDQPVRNDLITYDNIWTLKQVKKMIIQLAVC